MGGDAAVRDRFRTFFALPPEAQNRATLFGLVYRTPQYAPGNEHDLQAPWMPVFAGEPWRGAEAQRAIQSLFRDAPDGLPGNDDLGGLSAWYVWSALGLGPVTPGAPLYVLGSPVFPRAVLDLPGRKDLTIEAPKTSLTAKYVTAAALGGRPLDRAWVSHRDLRRGGTLVLTMSITPSPTWGTTAPPPSLTGADLSAFACTP
jgi:putative alpha-1,2-mannosidase